jgi:hypothetical protein
MGALGVDQVVAGLIHPVIEVLQVSQVTGEQSLDDLR